MSKNIYLPFIAVLFFSCSDYLPYSTSGQTKSITDIPLKQSAENVDCFFNNQVPSKPFYKVNVVEVTGEANTSYDELIVSLKNKAKAEGLDAVMILDKQQEIGYENLNQKIYVQDTFNRYYKQLAIPYQKLSAIGIKYAENITYLDTIVKSTAFEFSDNDKKNKAAINFDFYGNPIMGKDIAFNNFYNDSIEPFDINRHLLSKIKGWKYRTDDVVTEKVTGFKNEINDIPVVNAMADENDPNKFYYKLLDPSTNKTKKYTLKIEKDGSGRIVKKTLYQKEKIYWIEEIYFDKNITTGYKRYRINNNKEEIIFTATNQFYSINDLPKPL